MRCGRARSVIPKQPFIPLYTCSHKITRHSFYSMLTAESCQLAAPSYGDLMCPFHGFQQQNRTPVGTP